MTEFISYIWICIFVAGIILKILTYSDYYYSVLAASIILFFISLFKIAPRYQMWIFAILMCVLTLATKIGLKVTRRFKAGIYFTNKIIGKPAMVTEEINNGAGTGAVRLNGLLWPAVSNDEETIAPGSIVTVLSYSGDILICEYYWLGWFLIWFYP